MKTYSLFTRAITRFYGAAGAIRQQLLVSTAFGFLLLLARIVYTSGAGFLFLAWNLFLGFIPLVLSHAMALRSELVQNRPVSSILFIIWLLLIPNAFYMLTDLYHLYDSFMVPRWYDLLLILAFAWNALLMGILSVRQMEKIFRARWGDAAGRWFIYPLMFLNALGIYIGRYLRFNSWDIILHPFRLLAGMGHLLLHPVYYRGAWAMVFGFAVFLFICYTTLTTAIK